MHITTVIKADPHSSWQSRKMPMGVLLSFKPRYG